MLPIHGGIVDWLPAGIEGIICTSDLQGHASVPGGETSALIGTQLPSQFEELAANDMLPPLNHMGAILAGDLFAYTDKRGGYGNSRPVWEEWARHFRWVVGVVGNHDLFGEGDPRIPNFKRKGFNNIHVLSTDSVTVDGISFGGISGCIGSSRRPFRQTEEGFAERVREIWRRGNDITIMHDGPSGEEGQNGSAVVTKALEESGRTGMIVRGHCYWKKPLATLLNGIQVLNCDSRIFHLRMRR